jgi:uncharacterized protein (TIGR02996 family)
LLGPAPAGGENLPGRFFETVAHGRYPDATSDEAHLLAAIAEAPDEDTPRLVYADWLDEHDQPERAEFSRNWRSHRRARQDGTAGARTEHPAACLDGVRAVMTEEFS